VAPEDLLCFAGAEEAIYTAMRVLLCPDDHVIVITPNYQAAETVPLSICEVTGVPLDIDRRWDLDVDRLRAALRPNTKLISINFPNNPTGKIIPRADFDAIVELCRSRGIWLFSDEVYRLIERDPALRLPQAVDVYERAVSLNVMSKAYGLPGLRIGWLACKDRATLVGFERYKHYLSICNSAPSEVLARIALKARDTILARNRRVVRDNLARLNAFFADYRHLFDWREPDGGCVGFIRYRGAEGVEEFTRRLVEEEGVLEEGVLFLPSSLYRSELGAVPENCLRVGFGRLHVPAGLAALRQWMERNHLNR
jgi:aspartate/methionine/tyrosine aminotransferase